MAKEQSKELYSGVIIIHRWSYFHCHRCCAVLCRAGLLCFSMRPGRQYRRIPWHLLRKSRSSKSNQTKSNKFSKLQHTRMCVHRNQVTEIHVLVSSPRQSFSSIDRWPIKSRWREFHKEFLNSHTIRAFLSNLAIKSDGDSQKGRRCWMNEWNSSHRT